MNFFNFSDKKPYKTAKACGPRISVWPQEFQNFIAGRRNHDETLRPLLEKMTFPNLCLYDIVSYF